MKIGQLKIGDTIGTGVTVTGARRRGEYTRLTLSDGTERTLHKSAAVADLFIGHMPARSLMDSHLRMIKDVRASSPEWRGENVGRRGERTIARFPFDARALAEMHERQEWITT